MYKTYFKLKLAGITVYRVKIDAFTNQAEREKRPEKWVLLIRLEV